MGKGKVNPGANAPQNTSLTLGTTTKNLHGPKNNGVSEISFDKSKIKI